MAEDIVEVRIKGQYTKDDQISEDVFKRNFLKRMGVTVEVTRAELMENILKELD